MQNLQQGNSDVRKQQITSMECNLLILRPVNLPTWSGSDLHLSTKPACQLKTRKGAYLFRVDTSCLAEPFPVAKTEKSFDP